MEKPLTRERNGALEWSQFNGPIDQRKTKNIDFVEIAEMKDAFGESGKNAAPYSG
jgi:hypothetical protein